MSRRSMSAYWPRVLEWSDKQQVGEVCDAETNNCHQPQASPHRVVSSVRQHSTQGWMRHGLNIFAVVASGADLADKAGIGSVCFIALAR